MTPPGGEEERQKCGEEKDLWTVTLGGDKDTTLERACNFR